MGILNSEIWLFDDVSKIKVKMWRVVKKCENLNFLCQKWSESLSFFCNIILGALSSYWHFLTTSVFKTFYFLKSSPIFYESTLCLSQNSIISLEYVDFWSMYLILYPSLGNSTTHITRHRVLVLHEPQKHEISNQT